MVEYKTATMREGPWPAPLWPSHESVLPTWKDYACRPKESNDPIDSLSGGVYFSVKTRRGRGKVEAWRCRLYPQIEDATLTFLRDRLETVTVGSKAEMRRTVDDVRATMPVLDIDSRRGMSLCIPADNLVIPIKKFISNELSLAFPTQVVFPEELTRPLTGFVANLKFSVEAGDLAEAMRQFEYRLQRGGMSEKAARGIIPFTLGLGAQRKSKW